MILVLVRNINVEKMVVFRVLPILL